LKSNHVLSLFILAFWILFSVPVNAAWYQVEVIVFDLILPDLDGENWYESPGLPDWTDSVDLIREVDEEFASEVNSEIKQTTELKLEQPELIPFLQLGKEKLRLDDIHRILKLSREYRPLAHLAWQHPGQSSRRARAVHLQSFKSLATNEHATLKSENINGIDESAMISDDIYQMLNLDFEGTLRLRSSKFLHIDIDIAYFSEFLSETAETMSEPDSLHHQSTADYVRLQESRKIKLNEIHYFDHPLFGVVLRVSRLKVN
jgi:hypothetical protein